MNKAKIGVIGAGRIGWHHLRIYHELAQKYGNIKVHAFSRTNQENINETLEKLAEIECVAKGYDNPDEMLDKEKLDFVDICSPNEAHLKNIESAVSKGIKRILCEKPIASYTQLKQAYQIGKLAKENNIEIAVNMNIIAVRKNLHLKLGKLYSALEKTAPYKIEWSSGKNQTRMERIEDFMPHISSIMPNVKPGKIYGLKNNGVKIECENGAIFLSCSEDNKRQWTFYELPDIHNFSYEWENNKPVIKYWKNEMKPETFSIEDPLKTSLKSFICGKPLAGFNEGLENLVKVSRILK